MSKRLIDEIKSAGGLLGTNAAAEQAVQAVTNAISKLTGDGERVTIRGFGTFREQVRNERTGRNPRTGEPVKIAARKALVFKASR